MKPPAIIRTGLGKLTTPSLSRSTLSHLSFTSFCKGVSLGGHFSSPLGVQTSLCPCPRLPESLKRSWENRRGGSSLFLVGCRLGDFRGLGERGKEKDSLGRDEVKSTRVSTTDWGVTGGDHDFRYPGVRVVPLVEIPIFPLDWVPPGVRVTSTTPET